MKRLGEESLSRDQLNAKKYILTKMIKEMEENGYSTEDINQEIATNAGYNGELENMNEEELKQMNSKLRRRRGRGEGSKKRSRR